MACRRFASSLLLSGRIKPRSFVKRSFSTLPPPSTPISSSSYTDEEVARLDRLLDQQARDPTSLTEEERKDVEDLTKVLYKEVLRNDLSTLDLRGMNVVAKVVGRPNGDTFYDYGHKHTLQTPKPLHVGASSTSAGSSSKALSMATEALKKEKDGRQKKDFVKEEIIVKVDESDLMLFEGELLPKFQEPPRLEKGTEDPVALAWKMLTFAMETRRPVRARILNTVNGGFSVAIGAVVGFLPNSHLSPFMKGPISKNWDFVVEKILGEQVWVNILTCDPNLKNVVLSHRTVPRPYLLPQIAKPPPRPTQRQVRRTPRIQQTQQAKEDSSESN